jgi:tetratricopeptide (TPR) repeat protein/serine/threonine protein kinase
MNEATIFAAALDKATDKERAAFVAEACGDDEKLRRRVEALLRAHEESDDVLDPPSRVERTDVYHPVSAAPGTVIGPYKLVEQIGEGGMGTVWMAQQTEPVKRRVAVKLIKQGMDSKQVLARFEAERQALALMDHPNIAKVHDAGSTADGRPLFVMELVKGVPITRYCDDGRLTPRQRLELFTPVCQAIQHAHQKGVIHRDIKPSNVLIALYDDKPVPKVIDFGIAKATGQHLTERTLDTGFGAVVGTIEYMSPEQAGFNNLDIDTRSDVYSLGVLLYELLTGSPPFSRKELEKSGMLEMLRVIREQEPTKPSAKLSTAEGLPTLAANRGTAPARLTKLVRGELDWIVMRSLEKDRNRRYETANAFATDVQHYLHDEPVLACPPSVWYRVKKFARRQRPALMIAGLVLFFLVLLGSGVGWFVGDRSARRAQAATDIDVALRQTYVLQGQQRWLEALEVAKHTQMLLANSGGDEKLQRRVSQRVADLELIVKLEDAHLLQTEVRDDRFAWEEAVAAYAQAFQEYGMDVETVNPEVAGTLLRERGIGIEVAAALDDWFVVTREFAIANLSRQLLAIARAADPDPSRDDIRAGMARNESKSLEKLTAPDQVGELPAPTLVLMARVAWFSAGAKWAERVVALLRNAQRQHPDDFWINHDLAFALANSKPAQRDEAVRFYTAALALRPRSPGAYLNFARALKARGRMDEAIAALRRAIDLKPDYAHAHNNLATYLWHRGKQDEALAELQEAMRFRKDYFEAHCNLGSFLQDRGEVDAAISEYRESIRLANLVKKDCPLPHVHLAAALLDKDQLDEALAECQKALRLDKDMPDAHRTLSTVLKAKGELDEAIKECQVALRLKEDFAEAHNDLGNVLSDKGDEDGAIVEYRKAIRLKNPYPEAHYNLAGSVRVKGRLDEAIGEYREAILQKPNYAKAYNDLGCALDDKGQKEEAIAAYQEAVRLKKDFADPHYNLGIALMDTGRTEEAIAEYRKAIHLKKNDGRPHNNLGIALLKKGELDEAITIFREAIRIKKKYEEDHNGVAAAKLTEAQRAKWLLSYAGAHSALGAALRAKGELDQAIAACREAIRIKPDFAEVHNNLGVALADKHLLNEAIGEYRRAIDLKPDYAHAHNNLGKALREKRQVPDAIVEFRKAICIDKNYAAPHNGLGLSFVDLGRLDDAILEFREAIRIDKKFTAARHNLGRALQQKGQIDEAIAVYRDTIGIDKNDHKAHNGLGLALADKGLLDNAIAEFREAIHIKKDYAHAHNNLGDALRRKGELDEAIAAYRQAIRLKKDNAVYHSNLGVALIQKGELDKAIKEFQDAVQINPKLPDLRLNFAKALSIKGQLKDALAEFEESLRLGPKRGEAHNGLAWFLANCADAKLRDPARAVQLASKALQLPSSDAGSCWNTLGVARYRTDNWEGCIKALQKSIALRMGGDAYDFYFLAMAHHRLGRTKEADGWYKRAVRWQKTHPRDEELDRIQAEAEKLLKLTK